MFTNTSTVRNFEITSRCYTLTNVPLFLETLLPCTIAGLVTPLKQVGASDVLLKLILIKNYEAEVA